MWGRGIYFAVNASYSGGGYEFNLPDGSKLLIVARVLVGDASTCQGQNTKSLTRPPAKLDKTLYDSVTGSTGGSQVYIIYDNLQAYPEYLINYS